MADSRTACCKRTAEFENRSTFGEAMSQNRVSFLTHEVVVAVVVVAAVAVAVVG